VTGPVHQHRHRALQSISRTIERARSVGITLAQSGRRSARTAPSRDDDLPGVVEPLGRRSRPGTSNAGPTTNKRSNRVERVVDDGQILVPRRTDRRPLQPTPTSRRCRCSRHIPYLGCAPFRSESRSKTRHQPDGLPAPGGAGATARHREPASRSTATSRSAVSRRTSRPSSSVAGGRSTIRRSSRRCAASTTPASRLAAPQSSPGTTPGRAAKAEGRRPRATARRTRQRAGDRAARRRSTRRPAAGCRRRPSGRASGAGR